MKMRAFAIRNAKEILRDPLTLAFGIGFPLVLLFLLSAIQQNVPESLFQIDHLTPGIAIFGLSFMTRFSATIVSKDRSSAFLQRLYTTPMRPVDFILGYTLPLLPIALLQCIVCYLAAMLLGLQCTVNVGYAVLIHLPSAVFFIALGLLFGSVLREKQVGGICGALLTNLCAWLSGTWFDLSLVGGAFEKIAGVLPFLHAVEMERNVLCGQMIGIFPHIAWVTGYAFVALIAAVFLFLKQMKRT